MRGTASTEKKKKTKRRGEPQTKKLAQRGREIRQRKREGEMNEENKGRQQKTNEEEEKDEQGGKRQLSVQLINMTGWKLSSV